MFEMTFGDGRRRGMAFDGHDAHGVFMTKGGSMITKRDWPKMKRTLTFDELVSPTGAAGAGEKDEHERKASEMRAAMQELMDGFDLHDEVAGAISALLDKYFPAENRRAAGPNSVRGKGARDGPLSRHRAPGGDEDDDFAGFRKLLRGKGLDDQSVERAVGYARRDREEAEDRIPKNGLYGTGGHTSRGPSGNSRDYDLDLPDTTLGMGNYEPDPNRLSPTYDPSKGRDPAARLPGGGTSRRLSAGDAALDEDIERQIEREYGPGPKIGMFGL
jgi:hypothetical protein